MTERLTDEALDHGAGGSISTARFETVRYWLGHETGDVFGPDCDYDGPTLTVEVADAADARAMLEAISGDAFRRGVEVGWAERLKQEKNNSEVEAHRLRAENERLRDALADLVSWFDSGPSPYGPWIILAGERGADDAVEAAFAALSQPAPAPQPAVQMPRAWLDVMGERTRQMAVEGFTPEHDDVHVDGEIAEAAICYTMTGMGKDHASVCGGWWPDEWSTRWWKPTDPRSDLVKAGALILAEIERLDRAALAKIAKEPAA